MPFCFINSPCRYVAKQFLSHSCTHASRATGLPSFSCTLTLQKWQRERCLWLHHWNIPTRKQWELICVIVLLFFISSAWSSCWNRVRPFDMVQPRTIPQALGGRTCTCTQSTHTFVIAWCKWASYLQPERRYRCEPGVTSMQGRRQEMATVLFITAKTHTSRSPDQHLLETV